MIEAVSSSKPSSIITGRTKENHGVPKTRWAYLVNYGDFLTFDEFNKIDIDIQEMYLTIMIYLDVKSITQLAGYLKTSAQEAEKIAKRYRFVENNACADSISESLKSFEESILGNYRGPILISLRRAAIAAQNSPRGGERLLDAIEKQARTHIGDSNRRRDKNGAYELVDTVTGMLMPLPTVTIKNGEKKDIMKEKKTTELYGMEKVLGKAYTEIDENDFEKAIAGCPIKPTHDEMIF